MCLVELVGCVFSCGGCNCVVFVFLVVGIELSCCLGLIERGIWWFDCDFGCLALLVACFSGCYCAFWWVLVLVCLDLDMVVWRFYFIFVGSFNLSCLVLFVGCVFD